MTPFRRRQFLAGSAALATAIAGCSSNDGGSDPPELGTIADATPPSGDQPLPTPVAGDPDADVTVAAFEDYACPHCGTYSLEVFPQLAADYLESGDIRYEFHDFPIPVDEQRSWQAASAARAVQAGAGNQAYFVYAERLFRNQDALDLSTYESLTEGLSVDSSTVREAASDRRYDETVSADKQRGVDRGVDGTPIVFVDGEVVQWQEIAYDPVREAIEAARSA